MSKPIFHAGQGLEIEDGSIDLSTQFLNGIVDPSVTPGVKAPISSQFTRATDAGNGNSTIQIYDKFGPNDTDWAARAGSTGGNGTSTSTIGTPSDGAYTDGLFGFTPTTTTGDAVDTINEFLSLMAPPSAPPLADLGSALTGALGKLSFDSAHTIAGYSYDATLINTQVSKSGNGLGIFNGSTAVTGILNNNVSASSVTAFPAKSFGNGNVGALELWVNGTLRHSVDVSTFSSGSTLTSGSGFTLTAATPCQFSNGNAFPALQYRTGTITVAAAHQRGGYNLVEVKHVLPSGTISTNQMYWYNSTDAVAMSGDTYSLTPSLSTTRYLSGVKYYTAGTLAFSGVFHRVYADCYNATASAVSYTSTQASFSNLALPATTGNLVDLTVSPTAVMTTSLRLLGTTASINATILHPVKASLATGAIATASMLYDPIVSVAALVEDFNIETYRTSAVPALASSAPTAYDSTANVSSSAGLQCYNGTLRYPTGDFRVVAEGGTITYAPAGNPTYVGSTGAKTFIRAFQNNSGAVKANFKLNFAGVTTSFAAVGALAGNNISVEAKFPQGSLAAGTGWLDAYKDFTTSTWTDGAGCRATTFGLGRALATDWGMTIGTQSIAANEWVYIRVTAPASWTGYLDSITLTWL
jgi:hypothetical protein